MTIKTLKQKPPDEREEKALEESLAEGEIIYRSVRQDGMLTLQQTTAALAWSGIAAGISMGFSMIAEGLLVAFLPDAHWRPLVSKFGYSAGFLIVILGRQQLFTENTLTPVLPLLRDKKAETLGNMLRLWVVVLLANLVGALAMSAVFAKTPAVEEQVRHAMGEIGQEVMRHGFGTTLLKGIFAGWLIATIVWLLPFAETARGWGIIIVTYVVGIAQFAHVVAGAVEVFTIAWMGARGWGEVLGGWIVPTLIGNIIGGVTLVAALNFAQVVSGKETNIEL